LYEYRVENIKVVDGDTVDVDIDLGFGVWMKKQRIRLYGIDTPESRTKDKVEKVFGLAAKKRLEEILSMSDDIILRSVKDIRGKFGRILGDFVIYDLAGTCGDLLCTEGHAVRYPGQSKEEIQEEHEKNRKKLIQEGKVVL
jgi:micrococcal nuclease